MPRRTQPERAWIGFWAGLGLIVAAGGWAAPPQPTAQPVELAKLAPHQLQKLPDSQVILLPDGKRATLGEARAQWRAQRQRAEREIANLAAKIHAAFQSETAKANQKYAAELAADDAKVMAELAKLAAGAMAKPQ
jgi:hypothetical protein